MSQVEVLREGYGDKPMKWFYFSQNNSGGNFVENDVVCEMVFIQARSAREAVNMADNLFEPYSDYCPCCGPRWSTDYIEDADGHDVPTVYEKPLSETEASFFREKAILHYADGKVERVHLKEKQ